MKIFILYRWADSKALIDQMLDRLHAAYRESAIFPDIKSIPPGLNFSGSQHDGHLVQFNILKRRPSRLLPGQEL